jgi:S1-C subfamily serine protease
VAAMKPTFIALLVVVWTGIFAGCSSTNVYVAKDHRSLDAATFIISNDGTDPLGIGALISQELVKSGYPTRIVYRAGKPNPKPSFKPKRGPKRGSGSGFFISNDGKIITNAHVVSGAHSIVVRTVDGKKFPAKVLLTDEKNDIAILQPIEDRLVLKWLPLADSGTVKLGSKLWIIGFPLSDILGKNPRITQGIVSANVGLKDDPTRFQVSAAIQPGNSGGPVINEKNQVIGIATSKLSDRYAIGKTGQIPQNVNFAVKINYSKLLFKGSISKSIAARAPQVDSLQDAIGSTVLIEINSVDIPAGGKPASTPTSNSKDAILIAFNYNSYWDLIHHSLNAFNMQWVDPSSGEEIVSVVWTGDVPLSYKGIVKGVLKEVLTKADMLQDPAPPPTR